MKIKSGKGIEKERMSKEKEKEMRADEEPEKGEAEAEMTASAASEGEKASSGEFVDLVAELAKAREAEESLKNALTRERADFTNFRRLVETEKKNASEAYKIGMLCKMLPVLDDMELALKNRIAGDAELDEWAQGIELIARKYRTMVETEGVLPSAKVGDAFDPRFHQAIGVEENPDFESGMIIEVLSNGYILGDRTLKTAIVRVAA